MEEYLLLDAGSGGRASQRLIGSMFLRHFSNEALSRLDDAALLNVSGPLAMSTDSYTVSPLFFCRRQHRHPCRAWHGQRYIHARRRTSLVVLRVYS